MKKSYLVIGAGFSGAVLARELAEAGHYVTVAESRDHIAGNAYDTIHKETGIRYHMYGPHLFHTNNERVYNWLSQFTEWVPYYHQVMALDPYGEYVPFPPNKETFERYNHNREELLNVFFRPYTRKMWGMELEELDPNIINRVPMDPLTNDNRYFKKDKFQALPRDGYTIMIKRILDHENIHVTLGTRIDPTRPGMWRHFDHTFNCSPIDTWFDSQFGELPYRSIKFQHHVMSFVNALPTTTVNYTDDGPHTRITEWSKLPHHDFPGGNMTLLTTEIPCDYKDNNMERYYPVKDVHGKNREIYKKYLEIVPEKMTFIGRCGQYVYIDMDQAVNSSLQLAEKFRT